MIVRFVKLEIQAEHIEDFRQLTSEEREKILAFGGCTFLNIYQDVHLPGTFFSHSIWDDEPALDRYRHSDFFRGNWSQVKQWFSAKPLAWSLNHAHAVEPEETFQR